MSTALILLAAVVAGVLFAAVVVYLLKSEIRGFLDLAQQKFETERVRQEAQLESKKQAIDSAVGELGRKLTEYERLIREFEADRARKYGSLEARLQEAGQVTEKLSQTTEGLRSLLSNSRTRGQWGERMADDILRASGLQENIQYLKNRAQDSSATRPDFTFLMPERQKLNMDVKFPLDNYVRMINAQADEEKARFKNEFLKDVKARIKEIQKREYINPAEGTLDYVLLFIPNEQVYGFIHESAPGLIDESLAQKVVLCSPFTLYAVVAIVRQAFENFHFSQTNQEALKLISNFAAVYEKFRERFEDLGGALAKANELYQDITQTSYRRLDSAVAKIESARRGQDPAPVSLPLEKGK
jgi:DNA recombination protein RmuC